MSARVGVAARLALALVSVGCSSRALPAIGQAVVHVDTDAAVRAAPGAKEHAYLVDRLRIEIFENGRATEAVQEFAIDESTFRDGRASFGVVGREGAQLTARVRLFRADRTRDGEPVPSTTLDTTTSIPTPAEGHVEHVGVVLALADVGTLVGYPAPLAATPWAGPASKVGTAWPPAGCNDAPAAGEACVPGGVFLLGDPPVGSRGDTSTVTPAERVVAVSPFFVDLAEITSDQYRAVFPDPDPEFGNKGCTFGTPGYPMNCMSYAQARAYCAKFEKDLPTEAQYEWLASGLGYERTYPWGNDLPTCVDASAALELDLGTFPCRETPALEGRGARDRVRLEGGDVLDLAANLRELMRDDLGPSLGGGAMLVDPVGSGTSYVARGGSFTTPLRQVRATLRRITDAAAGAADLGFRCVRPAR